MTTPSLRANGSAQKRRPMTGSAKQSIDPQKERMDCFVATLLAMTPIQTVHITEFRIQQEN
jgi:hypothetical protein